MEKTKTIGEKSAADAITIVKRTRAGLCFNYPKHGLTSLLFSRKFLFFASDCSCVISALH